jgi:Guanine nucleotide exchange factor synembryn
VSNLFSILKTSTGDPPLKQPVAAAINALLNSDFYSDTWKNSTFPEPDPTVNVSMLISILTAAFEQYPDGSLNKLALPLTALIHKIYNVAPPQVKDLVKQKLLPSDADRSQVLGKGTSFSARLLRLTNTPSAPNLGESISILLYALSDNDPEKFVHNVGLGYGAGYLMNHGIPLPAAAKETADASRAGINPITGQRRDAEVEDDMPPMTDEEKEQEAEKLFVLFERFVVSQNPVRLADNE